MSAQLVDKVLSVLGEDSGGSVTVARTDSDLIQLSLIIHSEVSVGYDIPWRKTHQLLIEAALKTPGVIDDPRSFILETSLQDYYPVYQVNAYIRDANSLSQIYSDLHQNIQDVFNEAGIEIMSPHYIATRDGSETTIPKDDLREKK